jgi:hypothetical protein
LPVQIVEAGPDCQGVLPDYRGFFTARDNCGMAPLIQDPAPGTILTPEAPYIQVNIIATDFSNNTEKVTFDALLYDTIPPVIEVDSGFLSYKFESTSQMIASYHNSIGRFIDSRGGLDSVFHKKQLVTISGPGYNSSNFGIFYNTDNYVLGLDSTHLAALGMHIDPNPDYVNAGGPGDRYYQQYTGGSWENDTLEIGPPYNSERYGDFQYSFPTGPGLFNVSLYFTEIYWQEPGKRVFDVEIEGVTLLKDLDIFREIGFSKVLARTYPIEAFGETLDIRFTSKVDYAKVSGIIVTKRHDLHANNE